VSHSRRFAQVGSFCALARQPSIDQPIRRPTLSTLERLEQSSAVDAVVSSYRLGRISRIDLRKAMRMSVAFRHSPITGTLGKADSASLEGMFTLPHSESSSG
jgi:hypothetical protein